MLLTQSFNGAGKHAGVQGSVGLAANGENLEGLHACQARHGVSGIGKRHTSLCRVWNRVPLQEANARDPVAKVAAIGIAYMDGGKKGS